jgi:hypothetical protein
MFATSWRLHVLYCIIHILYCMIVMSSTDMNPYYVSSVTRDVFNETAWRWSQMWTETCSNFQIKPKFIFIFMLTAKYHETWYTTWCKQWRKTIFSSVSIPTAVDYGFHSNRWEMFPPSGFKSDLGCTQPPTQWVPDFCPWRYSGRSMKQTTHFRLVKMLIMRGYIPPFPRISFWRGV